MTIWEILMLAVGLSMDTCAVAIVKGLCAPRLTIRHYLICGLWLGLFQGGMPLIGYWLGKSFASYITHLDHWIAFFLLVFLGLNMIREALTDKEDVVSCAADADQEFAPGKMFPLAVATSIDALAVGVSFGFLPHISIGHAVFLIAAVTFFLSMGGLCLGHRFGTRFKAKAEIIGGIILIAIGTKILLEHLGILP